MTSKKQLIDEICINKQIIQVEICDSILEKAYKNQQCLQILIQKYPLNEGIQSFQLVPVSQYEDQSRNQLKQLTIEQLAYLLEDAQHTLDQVMYEELQINKLGLRMPKKSLLVQNYEKWDFLLQWPKSNNLESIIINVQSITNNIQAQLQRSKQKSDDQDDLQKKYQEALEKIEYLEMQLEQGTNKTINQGIIIQGNILNTRNQMNRSKQPKRDKIELMDELEKKLQDLETEKEKMSSYSMDAFSKLLQTKQY
ncbi:unnamed protein product (macronuclear) [Paramecium tetraurelia]|uniref:Uncharacterized protein n=1 Tax=Paramecium tetraurelia TaxID=5888 RepID=A0DKL7_PARTE|nr:uncharacterized protein GSPATT00017914001 [Paramecium tetraurelia]CAK83584.1 unnamed protein product [Paramecium tetraurelia]|eukprot:XP_001450981.1 hypothetical protein (macronuclear) [Paramecium tetraurelia strain d4-2]